MNFEIKEEPTQFELHGLSSLVDNQKFGEVGMQLMNEMLNVVKSDNVPTTGINYWVYLPDNRMFVGVELQNAPKTPIQLQSLKFELKRYLKYIHVGPYQELPPKWNDLKSELIAQGEIISSHSIEIYGHDCDNPSTLKTTILIGLQTKSNQLVTTIDRSAFETLYAGQPRWEIGRPQKAFINVADQITGSILDSGCGTGENAFFFSRRGHSVTGIDFLAEPISIAKGKAKERGLPVKFLVMDALTLKDWPEQYDNVIDSGLFHVFNDLDRYSYIEGLAKVLRPNGRFFFLCFSDEEPGTIGPRRVTRREIEDSFTHGWVIKSIESSEYEIRPDPYDDSFNVYGPKAWFVSVLKI